MSLLVPWMGVPVLLGLLCLGCGLALERIAETRLPNALLLPAGFATVIVLGQALTASDATAEVAAPAIAAFALAGLAYGRRDLARVITPGLAAALFAYLAYGAPVLATGQATFTGYIKLDDTATWLAITDQIMSNGRNLTGLAPSTFSTVLHTYVATGYPVGSFLPLGIAHELLRTDSAWLFQPVEAFAGGLLGLSLYALTDGVIRSPWRRAAVAAIAAQPATLFAYTQWGGIKEIVVASLLPLVAALALHRDRDAPAWRAVVPVAVAGAAVLAALSVGGIVWAAPLAAGALITGPRPPWRAPWRAVQRMRMLALVAIAAVCSIPVIDDADSFLHPLWVSGPGGGGVFTNQEELGKLFEPLRLLQLAGVWPAGDFRLDPSHLGVTYGLIALAVLAAWAAIVIAWRAGQRALPFYVVVTILAALALINRGSPWVDAKTMAEASPAIVLAALAAAAIAWERRLRPLAVVLAVAVGGGVLWSNALAYRDAYIAPRDQLHELEHIGDLAAHEGPTLQLDYSPFGSRHFLRKADTDGVSELRQHSIPLTDGSQAAVGDSVDIDALSPVALLDYRSIVVRRSPVASRPPGAYALRWRGAHYELWQRVPGSVPPIRHLALGSTDNPGAVPSCATVRQIARTAGAHGRVAAVVRRPTVIVPLGVGAYPDGWRPLANDENTIVPESSGMIRRTMRVTSAGRYEVWLGGSVRGKVSIVIDGRTVGSERHELNYIHTSSPIGAITLTRGVHDVRFVYHQGGLAPGSEGGGVNAFTVGPIMLGRGTAADAPVTVLPAARATELCGRRLDWLEALAL